MVIGRRGTFGSHRRRKNSRRCMWPPCVVTRTARVCWRMPAPTRRSRTRCVSTSRGVAMCACARACVRACVCICVSAVSVCLYLTIVFNFSDIDGSCTRSEWQDRLGARHGEQSRRDCSAARGAFCRSIRLFLETSASLRCTPCVTCSHSPRNADLLFAQSRCCNSLPF